MAKLLLLGIVVSVLNLTDSLIYFLLSGKPFSCAPTVTKVLQLSNILNREINVVSHRLHCLSWDISNLSLLLVWIHKKNSQKHKENLVLRRINILVRLMQRGGGMAACSAGEVGPFPAFFSTRWRRKRIKKFHVFPFPMLGNSGYEAAAIWGVLFRFLTGLLWQQPQFLWEMSLWEKGNF